MAAPADTSLQPAARPQWLTGAVWPFHVDTIVNLGQTIAYTDTGTGPTLLFVHVGMWSVLWRDVMTSLRGRYRCVTLDAPGNGLSTSGPGRMDLEDAASAVDRLVRVLDLNDITLMARDLGGTVALEAASRWPERVTGIVAINTFAWRPKGPIFRGMLAFMGNPIVREPDAIGAWLPRAASTRLGVEEDRRRDAHRLASPPPVRRPRYSGPVRSRMPSSASGADQASAAAPPRPARWPASVH